MPDRRFQVRLSRYALRMPYSLRPFGAPELQRQAHFSERLHGTGRHTV